MVPKLAIVEEVLQADELMKDSSYEGFKKKRALSFGFNLYIKSAPKLARALKVAMKALQESGDQIYHMNGSTYKLRAALNEIEEIVKEEAPATE